MPIGYTLTPQIIEAIWNSLSSEQQNEILDFIEKNEQAMRSSIKHYFLTRSTEPSPAGTLPTFTETEIPQNTAYDNTGIFCEACDEDFEHSPIKHTLIHHFPHWLPDKNPLPQY